MYTLTGVTKTYRKGPDVVAALRGVDLTIADGEWLAIQGPTGHGKTTLLQLLGGLDRPPQAPSTWPARTWPRCANPGWCGCAPATSGSCSRPST